MSATISLEQKALSKKYILYQLFTSSWFVGAVWLYFYRIFLTDAQIGILDAMAFAIALLVEIPSGALADKIGRARLVRIGQFCIAFGIVFQTIGNFLPIFIGQTIFMIGVSFMSGADEALFFDKLKFSKDSVEWKKLVTRGSQFALGGVVFATVVGGLLHLVDPRLPWFFTGLSFLISILVIRGIQDEKIVKKTLSVKEELSDYFSSIKAGFQEFKLPRLALYVPIIITLQALFYTSGYGLLRIVLLDRFTFDPFWGAVALATSSLLTIGVLHFLHKCAEEMTEKKVVILVSLLSASALFMSVANIGLWGFTVIFALYAGQRVLSPTMSEAINNQASDEHRATVLSMASFLKAIPYVALAPIIGYLNTTESLEVFLVVWAVLICGALTFYLKNKKTLSD